MNKGIRFECQALVHNTETEMAEINPVPCAKCGVCLDICTTGTIVRA